MTVTNAFDFLDCHEREIRLSVWDTGQMWYRSCKSRARSVGGWEILLRSIFQRMMCFRATSSKPSSNHGLYRTLRQ